MPKHGPPRAAVAVQSRGFLAASDFGERQGRRLGEGRGLSGSIDFLCQLECPPAVPQRRIRAGRKQPTQRGDLFCELAVRLNVCWIDRQERPKLLGGLGIFSLAAQ